MGKRMEINAFEDEAETIPVHNQKFYDDNDNLVLTIDTEVDASQSGTPQAGIKVDNPENGRTSMITGNGLFSNAGGYSAISDTTGVKTNASVVGVVFDRNGNENGISAGVIGSDNTNEETPGQSMTFGGFFTSLLTYALNLGSTVIENETSHTITKFETFLSCYNHTQLTISLPANPFRGRMIFIRRNNTAPIVINGNGKKILDTVPVDTKGLGASGGEGQLAILFWDGTNWTFNRARL